MSVDRREWKRSATHQGSTDIDPANVPERVLESLEAIEGKEGEKERDSPEHAY